MNMNRLKSVLLLGLATMAIVGCQSFRAPWAKKPKGPQPLVESKDTEQPDNLVALWSDETFTEPGKPATRGVGGRVYFYNDRRDTVPVAGQLVIYGYDDSKSGSSERKPDRKYVFTPQQFAGHFSESAFGPSYSFWIPWDAAGGESKPISLVPVFTTTAGHVVVGDHARHVLPGKGKQAATSGQLAQTPSTNSVMPLVENRPQHEASQPQVALTSYQPGVAPATPAASQPRQLELRTTSIRLPPTVQRRLISSKPNQDASRGRNARNRIALWGTQSASSGSSADPVSAPNQQSSGKDSSNDSSKPVNAATEEAESPDSMTQNLTEARSLTGRTVPSRPPTHFEPPKRPAPTWPAARTAISAPPWAQSPAAPPSNLPSPPAQSPGDLSNER